jgi:hypothetical protein
MPDWMLQIPMRGEGVDRRDEITDPGWRMVDHAREALKGIGAGHRHNTLNQQAFRLYRLGVRNFHMSEHFAREVLMRAARTMNRSDGKYDDD